MRLADITGTFTAEELIAVDPSYPGWVKKSASGEERELHQFIETTARNIKMFARDEQTSIFGGTPVEPPGVACVEVLAGAVVRYTYRKSNPNVVTDR